jgi:hypothetical protein
VILFVPGYDPQTLSNLVIAQQLAAADMEALTPLLGTEATRAMLTSAIRNGRGALFAMSHGQQDKLLGQDGEPAIEEIDGELLAHLHHYTVFAYACHTATRLGRTASAHGATWWGYTGRLQCPVHDPPFGELFVELFQLIFDRFWKVADATDRDSLFSDLRARCEAVARAIDDVGDAYADSDTFSAQLCALHVWDRLRIWLPGAESPEQHPDARPPALLLD